jgi:hypothetical protein
VKSRLHARGSSQQQSLCQGRDLKSRRGAFQSRVSLVARYAACIVALGASVAALVACGTTGGRTVNGSTAVPEFFEHLNTCLKAHGIANPEASARAADAERMIPALLGTGGIPVPSGVTKPQYEAALRRCGVTNVHVGRVAITNPLVRRKILSVRSCLANNGFTLPAANFPGPGPVLDTNRIDVGSARWGATVMGCSVTQALTKVALSVCMGKDVLSGPATGAHFEDHLLALPACLKKAGL